MSTFSTCTSATRPGSPTDGDVLFETDTKNVIIWDGTNWRGYNSDGIAAAPLTNTYSVDLDGTDDYVDLGNLGTAGLSLGCLSLWVKTDTVIQSGNTSARGYLAGWGSGSSFNGFSHGFMSNTAWILQLYSGAYRSYWDVGTGQSLSGGWHHIVLNHNGTGYEFYVDGVIASSHSLGGTVTVTSQSKISGTNLDYFRIGNAGAGFPTGGLFDEVGIWNSALTSTQISELYNSGVPISLSSYSPDGWWRMGDGTEGASGTTVYDMSSNSNNGTLTNGPTYASGTGNVPS